MISLAAFKGFFNNVPTLIPGIKRVELITDESEMNQILPTISPDEDPFLIVLVPSATSQGSEQNIFVENNLGLLYVLSKEDNTSKHSIEIQTDTQPLVEVLKLKMQEDKENCGIFSNLDEASFHTDPENKKFSGKCTGWSVSFRF